MKSFDKDLKKYSDKIKLKVSERRELRERILSYMEYHPLPKQGGVNDIQKGSIVSETYTKLHISSLQLKISGALLALVFIVVPVLAERSVPGEVLYILKTGVNEKIQAQLANSPYEKIEFETKLMERRIAEARVLASEGKLTGETKDQFEETVKEHAKAVRHELSELKAQDSDGAALAEIAFSSSLDVQSTVLETKRETEDEDLLGDILFVVNEARDETMLEQEENKPSYIGLVAQIEIQTTRAYELFETVKETATDEEIKDIERRLSDINRLFIEAKDGATLDENKSVADSAHLLGRIQKLVSFMTNIDVREAVTLDKLVPVVLSLDERTEIAKEEAESINMLIEDIKERVGEDETASEKVSEGLASVEEIMSQVETFFEVPDIDSIETLLVDARALVTDLDALTQPEEVTPTEETEEESTETEEESSEEESEEGETESVEETESQPEETGESQNEDSVQNDEETDTEVSASEETNVEA